MNLLVIYITSSIVTAIICKIDNILRETDNLLFMTYCLAGLLFPLTLPLLICSLVSRLIIYLTQQND